MVAELAPILRGWINYFNLSDVKGVFEDLGQWVRRRLRVVIWHQAKRARTRVRMLRRQGIDEKRKGIFQQWAWPLVECWSKSYDHAFPKRYFHGLGLVSLFQTYSGLRVCSA